MFDMRIWRLLQNTSLHTRSDVTNKKTKMSKALFFLNLHAAVAHFKCMSPLNGFWLAVNIYRLSAGTLSHWTFITIVVWTWTWCGYSLKVRTISKMLSSLVCTFVFHLLQFTNTQKEKYSWTLSSYDCNEILANLLQWSVRHKLHLIKLA